MSNVKSAYKKLGKNSFYDGMITSTTFLGSLVNRIVWRMNKDENKQYLEKTLKKHYRPFRRILTAICLKCLSVREF